jgi:hypothetical protein
VTASARLAHLLRLPRYAVLPAVIAGASAAYDPALRPRFELLALLGAFLFAVAGAEATLAARLRPGEEPRAASVPAWITLPVALVAAFLLVAARGWPMFWVCTAAILLACAFASGPRLSDTALAGPVTVVWMGPLATAGAALALVGTVAPPALWIGLPIGFLADAARRAWIAAAAEASAAAATPAPPAPPWFAGDFVAAYGVLPVLILAGGLPAIALLALAALPWTLRELARVRGDYAWRDAVTRTRLVHAAFALILAATTFAARVFATRAA